MTNGDPTDLRAAAAPAAAAERSETVRSERPARSWHDTITRWTHGLERRIDRSRERLKRPFLTDPLLVEPYLGYGSDTQVRVRARVLEDRGLGPAGHDDGPLTNLRNAWRRFDSDEMPGARVRVRILADAPDEGIEEDAASDAASSPALEADAPEAQRPEAVAETVAITDGEGFLDVQLPLPEPPARELVGVEYELLSPLPRQQAQTRFRGEALAVRPDAPYGVISDVDDTVLVTGATRLRDVLSRTLLQNARDRLPFAGAAALYRAFEAAGAPLFYVSSSPWNLYGVLAEFLDLNDLPLGPLLLRDWGVSASELLPLSHGTHKRESIDAVFAAYPKLAFVLVGDSGQEDPEIYAEVVERHAGRVLSVFVRHVGDDARAAAVRELARTLREAEVPLHLVHDSAEAARHAEREGLIDAAGREAAERAVAEAMTAPPTEGARADG